MAKKFTASYEQLRPDAVYKSKLASKFINCLMWDGKKSTATKVFYDAMNEIGKKSKMFPGGSLRDRSRQRKTDAGSPKQACRRLETSSADAGRPKRSLSLAIRWILAASRARWASDVRPSGIGVVGCLPQGRGRNDDSRKCASHG